MFSNYLKIAWRSLIKSKLFTALNLLGLELGLAVSLLLILFVKDEWSFDKYHSKANRIYRVGSTATFDGKSQKVGNAPNVVGPTMKNEVADVEQQARILLNDYGQTALSTLERKNLQRRNFLGGRQPLQYF
ncbi:MAG: hypothetical protein R2822_16460 [Spirosomataceae bacterium]